MGLIDKLLRIDEREIKKMLPKVEKIMALEDEMKALSDDELKNKTVEFKNRIENGEKLDDLLVEAFAVVREASGRVLGKRHYREQLIGGIVLHQGRIAEMKTGEGKTLVAALPAYLNALEGKGVHVITVNDYLAQRDKNEIGKVHAFLGLTTGVIVGNMQPGSKKSEYAADITYGTNSEFGFDYLRDNMVINKEERVQRPLNFAIVDEVDSIFIDEARTPLIIAGPGEKSSELYKMADYFAKSLIPEEDFTIDAKTKSIMFTDEGVEKAEKFYNVENYADQENLLIQHHTFQALRANYIMKKSVDYIINDGEVYIVDEFTGRVMEGRRFSEGLHEAIEAKEGVKIQDQNKTLATITYQNYFKIYKKLSGMTGTAKTEETEFQEIYGLDVVAVPTHKPIARVDREDRLYRTEYEKFKAVVEDIAETHKKGQPILVGTVSVEKSELLSMMLKKRGVPHQVLNAKNHAREAEIISHAGEVGMVTISTNMAGRGTDISLGEGAVEKGGLKVIGTERHESRRIDNQLRGRSGRQGDVGESVFYASLEDEIVERFAKERAEKIEEKVEADEKGEITKASIKKIIEIAQTNVEGDNFEQRKNVKKYDDVLNEQRKVIFTQRNLVVDSEDIREYIFEMFKNVIYTEFDRHIGDEEEDFDESFKNLLVYFRDLYLGKREIDEEAVAKLHIVDMKEKFYNIAVEIYEEKAKELGEGWNSVVKTILLKTVDAKWISHMDDMDNLKQYVGYNSLSQKDPVNIYQLQGGEMFNEAVYDIKKDMLRIISHINFSKKEN